MIVNSKLGNKELEYTPTGLGKVFRKLCDSEYVDERPFYSKDSTNNNKPTRVSKGPVYYNGEVFKYSMILENNNEDLVSRMENPRSEVLTIKGQGKDYLVKLEYRDGKVKIRKMEGRKSLESKTADILNLSQIERIVNGMLR